MDGLRDDEHVWRDVYFEREKRQLNRPKEDRAVNGVTKGIFGTRQHPTQRISTNLYDMVPLQDATAAGDQRALPIPGTDGIQGWWVMTVADARGLTRSVERSPICGHPHHADNPHHADIILPDDDLASWEAAKLHLMDFLLSGFWRDRG